MRNPRPNRGDSFLKRKNNYTNFAPPILSCLIVRSALNHNHLNNESDEGPNIDREEIDREEIDREEIGRLLESYRPWSRVFVRQQLAGNLRQRVDESDVIQNAWLSVVRNLDQFRGATEQEFFVWLRTILQNDLKNTFREHMAEKRDIRKEQAMAVLDDDVSIQWVIPTADDSTPSNRMIRGERALQLAKALEELPESQRQAIELRHLQGLKLADVADEMERTADSVVSLLRRGMIKLNTLLAE